MSSFLFSSANRGKHSRSPTPAGRHQQTQQQLSSPEATPLRSRGGGRTGGGSTSGASSSTPPILPLTQQDGNASPAQRRRPRGGTHNNFLAGGMNVDHKLKRTRRQPRNHHHHHRYYQYPFHRRTILSVLGGIAVLILVVRQIPGDNTRLLSLLFHYGRNRSRSSQLPITDPAIHLPPLEYTRALITERERLRSLDAWGTTRRAILERLAPAYLHRNDPITSEEEEEDVSAKDEAVTAAAEKEEHRTGDENSATEKEHHEDAENMLPLQQRPRRQLRTLDNMDDYPNSSSCAKASTHPAEETTTLSVTLVIQTSPDRLWILRETCRRWSSNPIVVVVAVTAHESENDGGGGASSAATTMMADAQTACNNTKNLDLVVHRLDPSQPYPVNMLRNMGLDRVRTSHVLVADIDFVPSLHLDDTIMTYLQARDDHDALVVPAFQRMLDPPCSTAEDCRRHLASNASFIPSTFEELQFCVNDRKECIVFQNDNNWEGHSSTGSNQWLNRKFFETNNKEEETTATTPRQLHCFDSLRYEPYVVLRWCPSSSSATSADTVTESASSSASSRRPVAPYYDERFHGYGKNKIQLIAHLRLLGYRFFVLPEGFIVHNPHTPSKSKREWENNNSNESTLHRDMDRLYESFLQALVEKYYQQHRDDIVVQCRHQQAG